jgi:hypothetical protein
MNAYLQVGAEVNILLGTKEAVTEGALDGVKVGLEVGTIDEEGKELGVHEDSVLIKRSKS